MSKYRDNIYYVYQQIKRKEELYMISKRRSILQQQLKI